MRKKMNFGVLASAAGLALLSAAALLTSCAREEDGGDPDGFVTMSVKASMSGYSGLSATRSDYDRINDVEAVNVVRYAIYTGGSLVDHNETGEFRVSARKRYDLYAIANVSGWSYPSSEEALRRQTMPAPAISSFATAGIPLAGCAEDVKPGDHNFTSEIPLKRLFSLVRLDLTPPAGATVRDVIINAFCVTNQNAVLTPFGESFYAEGVPGCAKAADDATDGHAYRDEVPAELTKGRYFVYVPENCSFVSGRTITPSGFYLRGSYALDGVKRMVDATTLIATGADATSALVSGQCRRNALVTVSLYDLSSAAEEPWLEVDPASLTDTMYVAEASSTFSAVVHNYAGGLTVSSSDNIRVLNAADGGLFADNGDGTATLSLRYGCLAEGDGTGTISVMKAGSAIRDGVISMRTKAPTLKFDKASYPLTNADRSQAVSLTYRVGDGSVYRSYDQALYDELTGIMNRRGVMDRIPSYALDHAGQKAFILIADLDHLKQINDHYGHVEGDFAIRKCADTLRYILGPEAIIGRIGGDEFLAVYPENEDTGKDGRIVRDKLRAFMAEFNAGSDKAYYVELSVGITAFTCKGDPDIAALTRNADARLYEDKAKRRASVAKTA